MLIGLIQLARPKHWVKNVFVVLPVPFALAAGAHLSPLTFLLGLVGFCLVNSAVYALNDLTDAKTDRLHAEKRHRPLAAGRVSVRAAMVQMIVLLSVGLGLCAAAGHARAVMAIVLAYVVINLSYSLGAKHVALLDVFLLSSGFVIRVLLGCALVAARPSAWLLLCTSALALFLGFAKRRADLKEGLDHQHRPSLRGYSLAFLDQAITITAGLAALSYALYSIETKLLLPGREMASMPFVVYGILEYLRLADVKGVGGSPVDVVYHSFTLQLCAVGWLATVMWGLRLW